MIPYIRPKPSRAPNILWLASYPKSGSTWMRAFLNAYFGNGEVDINDMVGMGDIHPELYQRISPIPLEKLGQFECSYLRSAALFEVFCDGRDTLMKTHCCNGVVWGMPAIPPEMSKGAIYVMRDPRDVCVSYSHHMGLSIDESIDRMNDETTMAHTDTLAQHLSTWSHHVMSWLEKAEFTTVYIRYEDMLNNPNKAFGGIAQFMTGERNKKKLRRALNACKFQNLRQQEEKDGFKEKSKKADRFFRKGGSNWKETLTAEQARRIEDDHGEVMKRFGYL